MLSWNQKTFSATVFAPTTCRFSIDWSAPVDVASVEDHGVYDIPLYAGAAWTGSARNPAMTQVITSAPASDCRASSRGRRTFISLRAVWDTTSRRAPLIDER